MSAPSIADARARTARDERGSSSTTEHRRAGLNGQRRRSGNAFAASFAEFSTGATSSAATFKITEHHEPRDWDTLLAHNDLELYDTHEDPDEIVNLAFHPESTRRRSSSSTPK